MYQLKTPLNLMFKVLLLLLLSSLFTPVFSQTPPKPPFHQLLDEGKYHKGLCDQYLDSFHSHKEISYLKLADHFCTESIKAYYRGYVYYFSNPEFRMRARYKMGSICEFYEGIAKLLKYHNLPHYKSRTNEDYCRER